jgi:hypothetical protein
MEERWWSDATARSHDVDNSVVSHVDFSREPNAAVHIRLPWQIHASVRPTRGLLARRANATSTSGFPTSSG